MQSKEDFSLDKFTVSDLQSAEKLYDPIDMPQLPSFGIQNQPQKNMSSYFQIMNNQNTLQNNSASQDKLLKSNKLNKKRKNLQEPNDLIKKKTVTPYNPQPSKKAGISDNSDDSNQEKLQQQVPELNQNSKITNFYSTVKYLKSKGSVQQNELVIQQTSLSPIVGDSEAQQKEIIILQQRLKERENSEKYYIQEYNRVTSDHKLDLNAISSFKKKSQDAVATLLIKNEDYLRQLQKIQIEKEKYRLGELVQRRDGVRYVEEWQDGYEIRKIKDALRQREQEREELEQQKKEIKIKHLQNGKKNGVDKNQQRLQFHVEHENSNGFTMTESDATKTRERITLQLSILQKDENDLKSRLTKLGEEKIMFVNRLKKYADEINCRFSKATADNDGKAWPLLAERYQLLSLLGKGGFSEVYKGFDLEELRPVACKIHHLNSSWLEESKSNYIKHALRENEIHQRLKHQNIVKSFNTIEINNESFCTVLEYCDGLDLSQYLKKYQVLTEKEGKIIIRQILSALNYLNSQGTKVIHYDLKPQNILFHKGEVKISDFGLCKIIDHDQTRLELTSQGLGTYWYLPPECFLNTEIPSISTKVDVWSVGVIMFEMVFGMRPFGDGVSQERIAKQVILKATQVTFPLKSIVTTECKEFIKKCLTYSMEARWNVQDAYLCSFIQNQK